MEIDVGEGKGKEVAEEAFWLAWQACGGTLGLGFLQDRSGATKEEVLLNASVDGDYSRTFGSKENRFDSDYVFGRMMKTTIGYTDDKVIVSDSDPRPEYQAWCNKYKTYKDLVEEAQK